LAVSYCHWSAAGRHLSVAPILPSALDGDERSFDSIGPVVEETRIDIDFPWAEARFIDPRANADACARMCLARRAEIQALITFDFWLAEITLREPQWHSFLATLQLGQWVADPLRGPMSS
jgi:hypothetical protein